MLSRKNSIITLKAIKFAYSRTWPVSLSSALNRLSKKSNSSKIKKGLMGSSTKEENILTSPKNNGKQSCPI
jgi:hypothetical protein